MTGRSKNNDGKGELDKMARNKYPGTCYACGKHASVGYGHFERHKGGWRIKCVQCASGRVVTDKDPCVIKAKRAAEQARLDKLLKEA